MTNAPKNAYAGFRFHVVKRTVTFVNANSLGRFEQIGGGKFAPKAVYDDVVVDGCDYLINASRFASQHRAKPVVGTVVYFVVDSTTGETVL